jgi:hypothetical protein
MSEPLELVDLGDATQETRQWGIWKLFPDSTYWMGEYPG